MKTRTRAGLTIGATCALLAAGSAAAQADLLKEKFEVDLPPVPWVVCADGTEIGAGLHVRGTALYWTDDAGEVVREKKVMQYSGAMTNLATGETRGTVGGSRAVDVDWVTGTFTSTGNYRTYTVPGEGTVLKAVGRTVYGATGDLLSASGPQLDETTVAGAQAVCALFGLPGGIPAPPPSHD